MDVPHERGEAWVRKITEKKDGLREARTERVNFNK